MLRPYCHKPCQLIADALSGNPKNAHLKELDQAQENLHLFKADVLDYDTLTLSVEGCVGVFHLATPVPEDKIVDPEASLLAQLSLMLIYSVFSPVSSTWIGGVHA
jgi:nucleoside-diphosphate-sugar epimerase